MILHYLNRNLKGHFLAASPLKILCQCPCAPLLEFSCCACVIKLCSLQMPSAAHSVSLHHFFIFNDLIVYREKLTCTCQITMHLCRVISLPMHQQPRLSQPCCVLRVAYCSALLGVDISSGVWQAIIFAILINFYKILAVRISS